MAAPFRTLVMAAAFLAAALWLVPAASADPGRPAPDRGGLAWAGAGGGGAVQPVDADQARREARRILSEERFRPRRPPRPFAGIFRRLGEWLDRPVRALSEWLGRVLPELGSGPWFLVALAVVVGAVAVTLRLSRDRGRERFGRGRGDPGEAGESPAELERRADEAERRGDLAEAVRLRFRAGLARLDGVGAIELRPGLTNAAASRRLRSRRFDGLAGHFDEVVYGGRAATGDDVAEAREGWPEVLAEAGGR